jgi:hypothetical protein
VDAIGLAGRCSGAVLCAEFSGVGGVVGGETVRSGWPWVQFGHVCNRACLGRYDRPEGMAGVAWHRRHRAVQGSVKSGGQAGSRRTGM